MIRRALICTALTAALWAQPRVADDPTMKTTEQTLAAVIRWEVLWNDSPKGFRVPSGGSLALAIYALPDSVSYCSRQAGVCATYRVTNFRNWEGITSASPDPNSTDLDALLAFLGKEPRKSRCRASVVLGRDLGGLLSPESGLMWSANVNVGTRAEIIQDYQQMHPAQIEDLKSWLFSDASPDANVRVATIACFSPTDPMVYYLVAPSAGSPQIMAVFWDKERREWVVASSAERDQGPERFDETRRTIESIKCSIVTLR